jgi:hypothetical protein
MRRRRSRRVDRKSSSLLEGYLVEGVNSEEKVVIGSEWITADDSTNEKDDEVTKVKVTHVEMIYLPVKRSFVPLVAYEWSRGSRKGREYQAGVDKISDVFSSMRRVK